MKIATPEQMNQIDHTAIHNIGIPGIALMENAAIGVVWEITRILGNLSGRRICLFAGKGNNGGDAFAVARHLLNLGAKAEVFMAAALEDIQGDAAVNLGILRSMGLNPVMLTDPQRMKSLEEELKSADLIVDGLLGTGLKGEVRGIYRETIETINRSGKYVISIDIPSGICGQTGRILGAAVKADTTVTLCLPKPGVIIHPGCEYAGKLVAADIGIPRKVLDEAGLTLHYTDEAWIAPRLPGRTGNSNKGSYGKVMIVSGSVGMTGAGCLAARGALRSGAGLVYLAVPSSLVPVYGAQVTEAIAIPLDDGGVGTLSRQCVQQILGYMNRMSAVVVGPGLSQGEDILPITEEILKEADIPIVLDADALNAVSKDIAVLKKRSAPCVITPHPGEMARLCGISIEDVQNNRVDTARDFSSKWDVITVLKGSRTIIAFPDGAVHINSTGNPGMATAGTGDVLAGLIASLIGQGMDPGEAAVAGVYLHGLAGDRAARIKGEHGLIAGDLADALPHSIKQVIHSKNHTNRRCFP